MQKRLTFTDDDLGRTLFNTLWDGIVYGATDGEVKSRDRRGSIATIQRALVSISDPASSDPLRPIHARVLQPGPHSIHLSGAHLKLVDELLDKVKWGGSMMIAAADLDDFLGSLPDAAEMPPK